MIEKIKVFFKIIILSIIILFTLCINTSEAGIWDDIFSAADNFLEEGANAQNNNNLATVNEVEVQAVMNDLYSILFPLGVVTTVIVGGVLGIKFMMSSAEDKAKVKESMVPYVIGCAVIYGAFGIWKIAIEVLSSIS